ncbi:MAG: glycosyltransferase [Litorimonas sp.]
MKVVIDDGARIYMQTGYGALARAIMRSLNAHSSHDIFRIEQTAPFAPDIRDQEELLGIPVMKPNHGDMVLRIARPGAFKYKKPAMIYTQHALSRLPPRWVENLQAAQGIIVPGRFDLRPFGEHFDRVYTCPQHVDPRVFKPIPRWREEGPEPFHFFFVGSYSYRKGLDILWEAFRQAFPDPAEGPVHLSLHCFDGLQGRNTSHLLEGARSLPSHIGLSCDTSTATAPWMNRFYNRADCVLTFSRGEGWCMPLHEALLTETPVIAPASTAMGEALPKHGVRRVKVRETLIDDPTDPFAASMQKRYGGNGAMMWEPDLGDAVKALREMRKRHAKYKKGAKKGGEFIRNAYSLDVMGRRLEEILNDFERNVVRA